MDLIKSLYSKYQSSIGTLKSMWESYCKRVIEIASRWELEKILFLEKLVDLTLSRELLEEEYKVLTTKRELGLVTEEEYSKRVDELTDAMRKVKEEIESVVSMIREVDEAIKFHMHTVYALYVFRREDIEKMLRTLDEMRSAGKVREDTYNIVKKDLETILKLSRE